ncbi:hypothetical protein G647_02562 [Cladophialophora carrionii CBS 160.54]|uniref:protein-histidine N-methyltransferase n=1 Tax=Cladophialophora carrionii CBS 160.54 TaxID=1279043 RepID=V9DHH7_9EURO|nr:uncharacterized protein G647_02562 [Cladophialophora carrionii CBS 160.54]ETI25788.1 hypothetical protein G647_02562 [Cladophialophora carrionii CBS 160.54]
MSFSFGFSGEDIEDDGEIQEQDALAKGMSVHTVSDGEPTSSVPVLLPKRHSLEELLASLPSQISYNILSVPPQSSSRKESSFDSSKGGISTDNTAIKIYRRSLFDMRAQLMAEANPSASESDSADTLLAGLENGDLSSGIYEGGFKTWECALDLASLLISPFSRLPIDQHGKQDWEIIELGAGSAIPSLTILGEFLRRRQTSGDSPNHGHLKLTLCDYNVDVLRLATAPNVLLNYLFALGNASLAWSSTSSTSSLSLSHQANEDEGDVDLEGLGGDALVRGTVKDLLAHKVSVDFISGGWGSEFVDLINSHSHSSSATSSSPPPTRPAHLLILASETIYSPASIKTFSQTLISLLRTHQQRNGPKSPETGTAKAWLAAKQVYFGVGGGVDEFAREVEHLGGRSQVIFERKDTGIGRVVLEVTVEV